MAITCPRCGAGFDVTLFQFGHRVRCGCGAVLDYPGCDLRCGHTCGKGSEALGPRDNRKRPAASGPLEASVSFFQTREDGRMAEVQLGKVTHYFSRISVAAIEITQDTLSVGDTIHIKGHTSDFMQKVDSIQIDGRPVDEATVGQSVGISVTEHAREHDDVYKVVE